MTVNLIRSVSQLTKLILKQIFCKHEYEFKHRWYRNDKECEVAYICVKCGKTIVIPMFKQ